jgi:hypothetical protein
VDECKPLVCGTCGFINYSNPKVVVGAVPVWTDAKGVRQGLTLVHFSAQPEPCLVTEATSKVHFSAPPETFLPLTLAT